LAVWCPLWEAAVVRPLLAATRPRARAPRFFHARYSDTIINLQRVIKLDTSVSIRQERK
jgi:hypothetical protein